MIATWYAVVALMLTAWAVLDGFDFGAGIVQHVVAKSEQERAVVLAAIGPVWDGNEVWLVAGGGVFFFAFPRAYAVAFSGMYLALMLVLWLLALRGAAIELRGQVDHDLWRSAWDGVFAFASAAMAIVAGVALGNVLRGVPIDASGWFHLDLFALTGPSRGRGAIDGYTALVGLMAVAALAAHGATYLAWKTDGDIHRRSVRVAARAWIVTLVLAVAATVATAAVRPAIFQALARRPWAWPWLPVAVAGAAVAARFVERGAERLAFLGSCAFISGLLLATASALYPVILPSTVDAAYDLLAEGAASSTTGLLLGLTWWIPAIILAIAYFVHLFRSMRGKVRAAEYGP